MIDQKRLGTDPALRYTVMIQSLFDWTAPAALPDLPALQLDAEILAMLDRGAPIALSVSGGKDSDAMVYSIRAYLAETGRTNRLYLIHADLGRAELKDTPAHVQELFNRTGIPLSIVAHSKFDLLDGIRHRMATRPDVPPWPSAKNRQCTSDWKRGPISRWIRNTFPTGEVICAMGLRADESPARAKRPVSKLRADCCASFRTVIDWNPIHRATIAQVWNAIGDNPRHPAYARGNARVSCALCILANSGDLVNGALQDPELFRAYCDIEIQSGFSFRHNFWLGHLAPQLLSPEQNAFYEGKRKPKT